jgi:hypothetical protein
MLGDRYQINGFGENRIWHCPGWNLTTHMTELWRMFRCKDPTFAKILGCLRTAKPTSGARRRGDVSVQDIMRGRRAWRGKEPTVDAMKNILKAHPETTMLAITRKGVRQLDELCLLAQFGPMTPLAVIDGDIESNPDNYGRDGKMKPMRQCASTLIPLFVGMQVYFTRNVDKARDITNGVRAEVLGWSARFKAVKVKTCTGKHEWVTAWHDKEMEGKVYFPIKAGYATTVLKVCGAELPHVTIWLDRPFTAGAAYTAMSRVSYGRDVLLGGDMTPDHFAPTNPR